jgi:protein-S-isoprenylcysteine O-methyltransferase Ste14
MTLVTRERAAKTSAWLLYTLIVLEILFMVSPFAAYYYSIYATPLNLLRESPSTAWLTMYLLPHFTYSDSWLANGLILVSWPLIFLGIMIFMVGFCQIYWSKFTGKGAVAVGLYRFIRHPQYVALAIIGLGTSLYWSRFIVVIAFVSMLCIYMFLAVSAASVGAALARVGLSVAPGHVVERRCSVRGIRAGVDDNNRRGAVAARSRYRQPPD